MTNKEKYGSFCQNTYVPIWSKPWWMDAVCGPENWDVWLYEKGDAVLAAMPYYKEMRGTYRYITKAEQTQNNGIIFLKDAKRKRASQGEFEEKIIHAACDYIESLGLDVYEQQYNHSFQNWSPFFWHNFTCVLRYTYVIENTEDLDAVYENITANYRQKIRKGQRLTSVSESITPEEFYVAYTDIFHRKNRPVPISETFWLNLYQACMQHNCGKMLCARDGDGAIHSILFAVWDEKYVYQLFAGYMQQYSSSQAYPALIWHAIQMASSMGLSYDFEGSMINGVAQAMREFGGEAKPYYRIRKVFNPEIVRKEAEDYISRLEQEQKEKEV